MAGERSRVDPQDVLPLSAMSLAQAQALPPYSAPAAGFRPLPRERLAE
jgi:hypothetical protein